MKMVRAFLTDNLNHAGIRRGVWVKMNNDEIIDIYDTEGYPDASATAGLDRAMNAMSLNFYGKPMEIDDFRAASFAAFSEWSFQCCYGNSKTQVAAAEGLDAAHRLWNALKKN